MNRSMQDSFEDWLVEPVSLASPDPRFEFRRALPDDFQRIFDHVDTVFGFRRSRAAFDWLYRKNPSGRARCWLAIDKSSKQLLASHACFPWPVARNRERINGQFIGDFAILPQAQRQGLYKSSTAFRDSHPQQDRTIVLGAPNTRSIGALAKSGRQFALLGPFPFAVLPLDFGGLLQGRAWPQGTAKLVVPAATGVLDLWHRVLLRSDKTIRIEELQRFDSGFDSLTHRVMCPPNYWCPHEADFLNWRYFQNPVSSYVVHVASIDEDAVGYSVVRVDGKRATLMELVVSPDPPRAAGAVLRASIDAAREAGCTSMAFFATPSWRLWGFLRRLGFLRRTSAVYRTARCPARADVSCIENWQLLPSDTDVG